jgi:hypothetical protein
MTLRVMMLFVVMFPVMVRLRLRGRGHERECNNGSEQQEQQLLHSLSSAKLGAAPL